MDTIKTRDKIFEIYLKAITEISDSASLLTDNNLNLSLMTFARQLFEVARTLEILIIEPKLTWAYFFEVRDIELKKIMKSKLTTEKQAEYVANELKPEIQAIHDKMTAEQIDLSDWTAQKNTWNERNKDAQFYNKLSEATHLDINHLIVHYCQTKKNAEKLSLNNDWDEQRRLMTDKKLFDFWLKRCETAIKNTLNH